MTWLCSWQLKVRKMERCLKQTRTDYLSGRSSGVWSSINVKKIAFGNKEHTIDKKMGVSRGVNPSKCQVVRVTTARDIIKTKYILHGQVPEAVTSARYLGLTSPMAYRGHADRQYKCNRLPDSRLYQTKHWKKPTKNPKVRETAYNTLVLRRPVWDPYTKQKILSYKKKQRRTARWITNNYNYRSSM